MTSDGQYRMESRVRGRRRRCFRLTAAAGRVRTHIDSHRAKCVGILCQNCVRYPWKPGSNTVIYGDTLMPIVVAEVVDGECVDASGPVLFPSVLLQPLGHLSGRSLRRAPPGRETRYEWTRQCSAVGAT